MRESHSGRNDAVVTEHYSYRMRKLFAFLLLTIAIACAPTQRSSAGAPPVNTAEIAVAPNVAADSLLVDVRSLDPTIVVDMRYATANNFTGAPLPGYEANRAFLRREAASALARVQRDLRQRGLALKIFDAYRPVRATLAMVEWTERAHRPELLKDGYIASRSRHNLGLAIDLTLIDLGTGQELEMGTAFDTFSPAAHTANAAGLAAVNRQKLKAAMEAEGFQNYDQEWWHYTFNVPNPLRFDRVIR
ncbi:MAG: zinc D-Ala-D-Ala dipeptidase [Gemmatimonadaceae bacterium]|jgi:D-alanyl-D-alanine dipeptidase|nr:zinc D-Ala-D-Ala dipeptidase [Gemmatimonadaceae bacterium]